MSDERTTAGRGPYVVVRAVLLTDGRTIGEEIYRGSEAECEALADDEPPMIGIDRALVVDEAWKVATVREWEALNCGR